MMAKRGSRVPVGKEEWKEEADTTIGQGGIYKLGQEIGSGAFGVVFMAMNRNTGETVAIKRFPLKSIEKDSLSSIEGEIELMQKLNHPNIVKYIDTIRTKSFLYIVLEYIENGSLSGLIKKFGFFSESLTAIYVTQVLKGLKYLHDQGVLHRDIKGANILTTKDGMVKLADFGVAIKLSDLHGGGEQDVMGSPYWLAPEIIELSAPTSACDIWSVGCIIIELLTGKPPYFELTTMAALFRIVSDDYPPLPEGISQALRDFLLNCFQKEPVMRSSATKLLEHPWLTNSSSNTKKLEEQKTRLGAKSSSSVDVTTAPATSSIMNTIRMHQLEVTPVSSSPSQELTAGSVDGIAMRKPTRMLPVPLDVKSASVDQREEGSARHSRPGYKSTPTKKTPPPNSSSPRNGQGGFFKSASGTSAGSAASRGVMLSNMETNSVVSDSSPPSGTSSVAQEKEIPMETLSKRGLVRHEGGAEAPPVEHCRSMSPISDSTVATKDNNRNDTFRAATVLEPTNSDSDFGAGFSDEEASPVVHHNSSFFSNLKIASDSDDDWEKQVVSKLLSASLDSTGSPMAKPRPVRVAPVVTTDKRSRSGSASEKHPETISLRNRSVDLVARLKSSTLNVPHAVGSFVLADGGGKKEKSGLSTSYHGQMLTRFQEDAEDENFDALFDGSSVESKREERERKPAAGGAIKSAMRADSFDSDCMDSIDTCEWRTKGTAPTLKPTISFSAQDFQQSRGILVKKPSAVEHGHLRKIGTRESLDTLRTLSSDDDFDDLGFEDGEADNFANKLREKLHSMGKEKDKEPDGQDEADEFINYQFDEKDFKQNEQKDIHFRRSREVVDLLSKVRVTSSETEMTSAALSIIAIFDEYPDQREHLITYHGVMPIIDMFESQSAIMDYYSSSNVNSAPNSTVYGTQVLQIVNKIIEGSVKAQEQLSLMGIIPTVMNLFEKSCRPYSPNRAIMPLAPYFASASSSVGMRTPRVESSSTDEDGNALTTGPVDPVIMEAARFIHQISLSSSLTLQMLIGAGGLMVLTTMVSFGARIGATTPRNDRPRTLTRVDEEALKDHKDREAIRALASTSSDDFSSLAAKAGLPVEIASLKVNVLPAIALPSAEDAANCMIVFQMGMDCIAQLFSVQSSRTRDFCRLFVKLGLLSNLSVAFMNLKKMYYQMMRSSPDDDFASGGFSSTNRMPTHRRAESNGSIALCTTESFFSTLDAPTPGGAVQYNAAADDTPERIYAHMIATLFFKFSRSDSVVAETMANPEKGVIKAILDALTMSELQRLQGSPSALTTPSSSKPLPETHSSSNMNLIASNAPYSANTPFTSSRRLTRVATLSPAYLEMLELLLKCLKNLSMEPSALNDLERAGTIETILPLLSGPLKDRYIVHILPCLFNMCRINKRRQELAATLGIVPHLKKVIAEGSHLRQFALPIIFDLAHTSNSTRMELWKNDCVSFYVNLLKENYWQAFALNSLAVWMLSDAANVSKLLVQPVCLSKLIDFFDKASNQTLHSLHKPLLDIMSKSAELSSALSYSGIFIAALVRRLNAPQEAIVLRTLLKMLQLLHQYHASPRQLVLDHGLYDIVKEFAQSESQVLVCQIANKLLADFQLSTFS